jgi:HEAT repeat protein
MRLSAVLAVVILAGTPLAAQTLEQARAGLSNPDPRLRGQAAMALSEMGTAAAAAVPELTKTMADRNLNVRYWTGKALTAIGPQAAPAIPQLVATLGVYPGGPENLEGPTRYYADARLVAAQALGAIGPPAKGAVPALRKLLTDPDETVQVIAQEAIEKIEDPATK